MILQRLWLVPSITYINNYKHIYIYCSSWSTWSHKVNAHHKYSSTEKRGESFPFKKTMQRVVQRRDNKRKKKNKTKTNPQYKDDW